MTSSYSRLARSKHVEVAVGHRVEGARAHAAAVGHAVPSSTAGSRAGGEPAGSRDRTKAWPRRSGGTAAPAKPAGQVHVAAAGGPLDDHDRGVGHRRAQVGQHRPQLVVGQVVGRVGEHHVVRRARQPVRRRPARPGRAAPRRRPARGSRRWRPMVRAARGSDSTSSACAAPRLSASSPTAPDPAYRSSTRRPAQAPSSDSRVENRASRARSEVGRVPSPGGTAAGGRVRRRRSPWSPAGHAFSR